jgi:hypothetical protein
MNVDDGVYWSNVPVMAAGYNNQPCDVTDSVGNTITGSNSYMSREPSPSGGWTYTPCTAESPNVADCDVTRTNTINNEAALLLTSSTTFALSPTNRFLYVNLPPINYDLDQIISGDTVSVQITLLKTPCGELFTGTVELGILGCAQVKPTYALVYPYFTEDGGDWWSGLAITNLGKTDGSATIYFHEADGDVGTLTVQVGAGSIYAEVKDTILNQSSASAGAVLGNARAYAVVCTDFNADGFALIGNNYTGVGQGYIPRLPNGLPIDCIK